MTSPPQDRTALYRLHDAEGVLLYVGITHDPKKRFSQHAASKRWWPDVASRTVEWFETRNAAASAEEAAIKAKAPQHNVVHSALAPASITVEIPAAWAVALDILERELAARFTVKHLGRAGVLIGLLDRELSARGLYGDARCWHSAIRWPEGVRITGTSCGCGGAIAAADTPAGG